MSSVYAKNGVLYYSYYYTDVDGERKQKAESLGLKDTRDNRRIAKRVKEEKDRARKTRTVSSAYFLSYPDAAAMFLKSRENLAKSSYENYRLVCDHFEKVVGDKFVREIDEKDIEFFKAHIAVGRSKYTVDTYLRSIHVFFTWLKTQKLIDEPPFEYKKLKPKGFRVITEEEKDLAIASITNEHHKRFLQFLAVSGFRTSEAVALRWEDINWEYGYIIVRNQKAKREDHYPLHDELRALLNQFRKEEGLVFGYKNTDSLRTLAKKINISFQDLRKYFGTKWAKKLSMFELQRLMRHEDIKTTSKYYVSIEMNDIAEKMKVVKR